MCGIAGLIGIAPELATSAAERMRLTLRHRGPDAHGIACIADPHGEAPPLHLIHTRLAILDLSDAGRQPMSDESSQLTIVFNGEIYNFQELREELQHHGFVSRTGTDTEVILHAYRCWGESFLGRLRGMFAFAIADSRSRSILLARDRLGIKPLYLYHAAGGGLLFASEVRTLLTAGPELVSPRLNLNAMESFLAQGAVFSEQAHVQGVYLLAPGEARVTDWSGRPVRAFAWWSMPFTPETRQRLDRKVAIERLGLTLRQAVKQHLIADVPVGVFLSSGIDSTSVATLATEAGQGVVQTVSIGFDQADYDETAIAEDFAKELGTQHQTVRLSAHQIQEDFEQVLAAVDQPTVDGFNTYYVSRAARQLGLTVALSGLGGDELFGGYRTFRDVPHALKWLRWLRPLRYAKRALATMAMMTRSRALLKAAESLCRPRDPVSLYLLRRELFRPDDRRELLPHNPGTDPITGLSPNQHKRWLSQIQNLDLINQVSFLELTGYMRHMLLRDSDVFSMAHALELRVPLLDHEVVEVAASLPGVWKQPGPRGEPKPLLTEAVGPRLPQRAKKLAKRGFTFPWSEWFRGGLARMAEERLQDRRAWQQLGFDPAAPARMWQRFLHCDPRVSGLHVLALVVLADLTARQKLSP